MTSQNKKPILPVYHGIERSDVDYSGRFHFATLKFLQQVDLKYRWPILIREQLPSPPWPNKWLDTKFGRATDKLADTFGKLHIASHLFNQEQTTFIEFRDAEIVADFAKAQSALQRMPIFLDCMLFYLRIMADCIANVTPNLYGDVQIPHVGSTTRSMSRDSFNEQRKWFKKHGQKIDPEYQEMLANHTSWFDLLADRKDYGYGL